MSKLAPKLLIGLASFALLAGSADAGTKVYKKRVGFFESLFGGAPPSQTTTRRLAPGEKLSWFEQRQLDKQRFNGYDTALTNVPSSKKARQFDTGGAEPEPLPGLGMGNVRYTPPLVVPVYDAALLKFTTTTPETEAIRIELINKATAIRTIDVERKAILAFYSGNGFKPVWTQNGHIMPRAANLLKAMSNAASDGLVAKNYLPTGLTSFEGADEALASDSLKLTRFDIAMTVAAVKYARHMSGGQFDPNRLSLYNDIKPATAAAEDVVKVLGFTPFPEAYVASLAPRHPQYAIFKDALAKLADTGQKLDVIAAGADIKPGKMDERIPAIRARLQALGITVAELDGKTDPNLLDKKLASSLRNFQAANKLKANGVVDVKTLAALNADHSDDERQRLIFNMERLRWLPRDFGTRYVLVNQPAFEVNVFDHGKVAWNSRVIVGKPMNQTYSFYDQIETVVFNPSWGVPASIIINEYGPKSRKDPGYLDRNGFTVVNANGQEISSRDVNWWSMGHNPTIGVRQPPGSDNALGELKFLFPNAHDIYMHDTPTKPYFAESVRAFSHGCVRVQNPREFAAVLLGWDQDRVAAELVMKGDSHNVALDEKVPVYLTYFTAWTDENGKVKYFNDIYGRDAAMAKAFAFDPFAKTGANTVDAMADGVIDGTLSQN